MKLYKVLARVLRDAGVEDLFGVLGDGNLFLADSYVRGSGGRYHPASHEAGAVGMAQGYASRGDRLGVATVTHGPGLTNAFTSLINGVLARDPLVVIAGETPASAQHDPQSIDQREIIKAAGALVIESRLAETAATDLARAIETAIRESTTVVFTIPSDLMWDTVEDSPIAIAIPPSTMPLQPAPDVLENVAALIATAQRPIVLVGRGVPAEDRPWILALAKRMGAPLATTLRGKGAFGREDGSIGIFGGLATPPGLEVIGASDFVIAFGSSLNYLTTDRGGLVKEKTLVRVDKAPDPGTAPFVFPVNVAGDAGAVARAVAGLLDEADIPPSTFRGSALVAAALEPDRIADETSADGPVGIDDAMRAINDAMPRGRTLVTDGGRFMRSALRNLDAPGPEAFVFAMSFHAVGTGMPAAIGAAVAASDPVLFVTGDGGFMMSGVSELYAAVREGLDFVVIICNDGGYGAEYVQLANRDMDPAISLIDWPDFAAIAAAMGCSSMTVRTHHDLALACEMIAQRDRPVVVDLRLDPSAVPMG